ncbi:flavodoxin family protein [Kitasatospora viridis]|uniref:Multimeric flavodoxin WrbA n=1 Tax=Kitasatospora viridis TaxID=281105 RepID=A0A561UPK4_9ACTN|nr:flavodoxin family protein [Kitasatospora viridis]TWG01289.1 multimeric flavodoxin WrbA [Kitasatospora viridis]
MTSPVISIAFHSGFGHTEVIADAVRAGAASTGATVHLIKVDGITDEQWELLDGSDAIIFGTPTYMGNVAAAFQAFAEASSKRWYTRAWQDKLAAGFTNSGSKSGDKLQALQAVSVLAAQQGMHWINLGLLPGWNSTTSSDDELNRLGFSLGAAAQSPVDAGAEAVHKFDVATAEHLGRRVAEQAAVFVAGKAALAG